MMSSAFFFFFCKGAFPRPFINVHFPVYSHSCHARFCSQDVRLARTLVWEPEPRLVLCRWVLWWETTLNLFPIMLPGQSRMINVPLPSDPWRVFLPVLTGPAQAVTSHVAPSWLAVRMVNSRNLTSHSPPTAALTSGDSRWSFNMQRNLKKKTPSPKPMAGAFKCKDLLYLQLSPLERTFLTPLLFEHSDVLSYFQVQQLKKYRVMQKTSRVTSLHQLQVW